MSRPCFIGTASFSQQENDMQNRRYYTGQYLFHRSLIAQSKTSVFSIAFPSAAER